MRALGLAAAVVLPGALIAAGGTPAPARREHRIRYTRPDREVGRFQYVPFTVPAGTTRLRVALAYDGAGGANVLDLGLLEPGPLDLGTPALRGWSGAAATEVVLGPAAATPGYWPGPLPAGEWHALIGLYKVGAAGVDLRLTTETSADPEAAGPVPVLPPRATGPLRKGPAWYSGGVHVHTVHSDGRQETADVARRAREAGLDFIVITDHNNTTHQLDAVDEPELLRIVGEEITTPGGHAGVWGLGGWRDVVDFRLIPGDERIKDLVRAVGERGGLVAVNHPRSECAECAWEHAIPPGVVAMEITDPTPAGREAQMALWDTYLRRGRRLVAIGSSDWHQPDRSIGVASVRVWAEELSERAVLDAVRAGRVVVMADGQTLPPVLAVRAGASEARVGDTLTLERGTTVAVEVASPAVLARGRVDLVWDGAIADSQTIALATPARFARKVERDGYVRAHAYAFDGTPVAVTNPVFVKVRPPK
jgi:predicted metal-dependent phosphoesterase TrpH